METLATQAILRTAELSSFFGFNEESESRSLKRLHYESGAVRQVKILKNRNGQLG